MSNDEESACSRFDSQMSRGRKHSLEEAPEPKESSTVKTCNSSRTGAILAVSVVADRPVWRMPPMSFGLGELPPSFRQTQTQKIRGKKKKEKNEKHAKKVKRTGVERRREGQQFFLDVF